MGLFAHHIAVEFLGQEFSPQTPMEHVIVFAVTGIVVGLTIYGACALVRDLRHWRQR